MTPSQLLDSILIVVLLIDVISQQFIMSRLRKKLLALASARSQSRSDHEIALTCDNSDALKKIGEVERAAKSAAHALQNLERSKPMH